MTVIVPQEEERKMEKKVIEKEKKEKKMEERRKQDMEDEKKDNKTKAVETKMQTKNPAHGIQSISLPMRIVAPIPRQGGPRISKNPIKKRKKSFKTQITQKSLEICKNQRYTLRPEVSHPSGSVVFNMFCTAKSAKKKTAILDHFQTSKNYQAKIHDCKVALWRCVEPRIL